MNSNLTKGNGGFAHIPPGTQPSFDVWLDKQDIMQEFHISERTLHNWRKKKYLPFTRLGRRIFYNRTLLEKKLLQSPGCMIVLVNWMSCFIEEGSEIFGL